MQPVQTPRRRHAAAAVIALLAVAVWLAPAAWAGTLDQVRSAAKINLGYRADATPFSYRNDDRSATGYSVALCQKVVDAVKAELGLSALSVQWVPVTAADRFKTLQDGKVDLLCGTDTVTLARRKDVSFSIPIFPGGIGAVLRSDGPAPLRDLLTEGRPPARPIWRGDPARTILEKKTFSVVSATTAESWLTRRLNDFDIDLAVVPVDTYQTGIQRVLDGRSDVFFGDRPVLLDAVKRSLSPTRLSVIDRQFTYEEVALAVPRADEDFRLLVDRTLSRFYGTKEFWDLYAKWFGKPSLTTAVFFAANIVPD